MSFIQSQFTHFVSLTQIEHQHIIHFFSHWFDFLHHRHVSLWSRYPITTRMAMTVPLFRQALGTEIIIALRTPPILLFILSLEVASFRLYYSFFPFRINPMHLAIYEITVSRDSQGTWSGHRWHVLQFCKTPNSLSKSRNFCEYTESSHSTWLTRKKHRYQPASVPHVNLQPNHN